MTGPLALVVFALGLLHVLAADPWTGGAAGSRPKSEACRDAAAEPVTLTARREGARPRHWSAV
jgi:hypothetical protein